MSYVGPVESRKLPSDTAYGTLAALEETASAWGLTTSERAAIVGASEDQVDKWLSDAKAGLDVRLPEPIVERTGYIWNLRGMFGEMGFDEMAASFIRDKSPFSGETPLERAIDPDVDRLRDLCAEIDAIFGEGCCSEPFCWIPNMVEISLAADPSEDEPDRS